MRGLLVAGALGALSGCGPAGPAVYPVSGVVVFPDGAPVKSGTIEFEPADGGPAARGTIGPKGRFTLQTNGRDGAVAGSHRVAVVQVFVLDGLKPEVRAAHSRHSAKVVNPKHARFDTSGLACKIGPEANEVRIEVTAAERP
ncbi:carboxypeptidase regulatory-like domain-containing protein [bacterium]|nr:carboxypeptidase regulatory-like domain-containing protein [bacterium]